MAVMIDGISLIGLASGVLAEVETNTKALRVAPKHEDLGGQGGGAYCVSGNSNITNATSVAVNGTLLAFRWAQKQSIARIRKVAIGGAGQSNVAGTAGAVQFSMFAVRRFIGQYASVGGSDTITNLISNPLRQNFTGPGYSFSAETAAPSDIYDLVIGGNGGSGGALGGQVATLDTNPMATVVQSRIATAGSPYIIKPFTLWEVGEGDEPLDLSFQEGFAIKVVLPTTGVATANTPWSCTVTWSEVPLTLL